MIGVIEGRTTDSVIQMRDNIIDYVKKFILKNNMKNKLEVEREKLFGFDFKTGLPIADNWIDDKCKEFISPKMERIECEGIGDNNGYYEMRAKVITVNDCKQFISDLRKHDE
jgi:hypothetical protein